MNDILLVPDAVDMEEKEKIDDGLTQDQREVAQQLKESFGFTERSEEEEIELKLEKNKYYLLDEENNIID